MSAAPRRAIVQRLSSQLLVLVEVIRVRDWFGWDDRRNAQQSTALRDFDPAVTAAAATLRA